MPSKDEITVGNEAAGAPLPAASPKIGYIVSLSGNVQGIGFRKKILRAAQDQGLCGWIVNMPDGKRVKIFFDGESKKIKRLCASIYSGKFGGRIDNFVGTRTKSLGLKDFIICSGPSDDRISKIDPDVLEDRSMLLRKEFSDINKELSKSFKIISKEEKKILVGTLKSVPVDFLGGPLVRSGYSVNLPAETRSFTAELWNQTVMRDVYATELGTSPENFINFKRNGQKVANAVGLRTPTVHQFDVPFSEINVRPGIVIKPITGGGSKGVFAIFSESRVFSLGYERELGGIDCLSDEASKHLSLTGDADRWMVEEFILDDKGSIPNDIKLLTFYGKVALIQEATRMPTRVCYWLPTGERIRTGRYEYMQFDGEGLPLEYVEIAEEVSLKIPVPFVRIDILKSVNGPVFGEFTPRPGNFHEFNVNTDRMLGKYFVQARARLIADLYRGKKFPEFDQLFLAYAKNRKAKNRELRL